MIGTRIKELIFKGTVNDDRTDSQEVSETSDIVIIDKEEIIEACLERVKAYLEYERGR